MLFIAKAHKYKCINNQVDKLDKIQMGHDAEKTLAKELKAKKAPAGDMLDMTSDTYGIRMTVYHSNISPKYRKIIMNKNSAIKSLNSCKRKGLKPLQVLAVAEEDGTFTFYTHSNFESIHWSKMKPWKGAKVLVPIRPKPIPAKPKIVPKKILNVEKPKEYVVPKKRGLAWRDTTNIDDAKKQFKERFHVRNINMKDFDDKTGLEALNRLGREWSAVHERYPKIDDYLRHRTLGLNLDYDESWKAGALSSYFPETTHMGFVRSKPTMNFSAYIDTKKIPARLSFGQYVGTCGYDFEYISRHELGHHLDFLLHHEPGNMSGKFRAMYLNNRKEYFEKISFYAATNEREGFAEAFAAYTSPLYAKSKTKLPKAVEKFFKELLE